MRDLAPLFGVRTASGARRACIDAGLALVKVGRHLAVRRDDLERYAASLQPVAPARAPMPAPEPPEWARDLLARKPRGYRDLAPRRRGAHA